MNSPWGTQQPTATPVAAPAPATAPTSQGEQMTTTIAGVEVTTTVKYDGQCPWDVFRGTPQAIAEAMGSKEYYEHVETVCRIAPHVANKWREAFSAVTGAPAAAAPTPTAAAAPAGVPQRREAPKSAPGTYAPTNGKSCAHGPIQFTEYGASKFDPNKPIRAYKCPLLVANFRDPNGCQQMTEYVN